MNDAHLHRIPRSETELREALAAACHGKWRMCVPPQVDDHDFVLGDGITELVALRAENARLRASLSDCLLMLEPVASADIWDTPYEFYPEHEAAQAACVTARAVLGLTAPDSSATLNPEP